MIRYYPALGQLFDASRIVMEVKKRGKNLLDRGCPAEPESVIIADFQGA